MHPIFVSCGRRGLAYLPACRGQVWTTTRVGVRDVYGTTVKATRSTTWLPCYKSCASQHVACQSILRDRQGVWWPRGRPEVRSRGVADVKLGDNAVRDVVEWGSPLRRPCSWKTTLDDLGRHQERWRRIAACCALYWESSRVVLLCFVRVLFVSLTCFLFVYILIRKLYKNVIHFLRPTHMRRHGVTVGVRSGMSGIEMYLVAVCVRKRYWVETLCRKLAFSILF